MFSIMVNGSCLSYCWVYLGVYMLEVIKNNDEQTNIVVKNFGKLSPFSDQYQQV